MSNVLCTLQSFPMNLKTHLEHAIRTGTVTLTVPWICDILVMMDAVCITLEKSKEFLYLVNQLYVQVFEVRQECDCCYT